MEYLLNESVNQINATDISFVRDFINKIEWRDRLIGIKGARGVGKTTLVLQYIKLNLPLSKSLYVSLDNIYFSGNRLVDLADEFVKTGGEYLILDEVHRYAAWSAELKNIYDVHKNLKIIFTGSSILHIDNSKADLSRRAVIYDLPGFSLREYINLKTESSLEAVGFETILKEHLDISAELTKKFKPILLYNQYLKLGYYPFFLESELTYYRKIREIINVVMEVDIPQSFEISLASIEKIKKLLYIISTHAPFKPNIQKISEKIDATRNTVKTYLHYLDRAKVVNLLQAENKNVSLLQKPEKIFLHHPNLIYAYAFENSNIGTIRETFFLNQVGENENVTSSKKADFIVNEKFTIEIGGKNKTKTQIEGIENAYIVSDNIEHGFGNKIPLWLFGFLY
jgi:predicted AAA+ superfamily ATPase